MTVTIVQIPARSQPFLYDRFEYAGRFVMTRENGPSHNPDDDARFEEVIEWCRSRWGRPLQAYDCGDIPVRRWAVYQFLSTAYSIYLGTTEQAFEFKMRWC